MQWIYEAGYKKSPSFSRDFIVLLCWLVFLIVLVVIKATGFFSHHLDFKVFSGNLGPIFSLFGTVCLAYEFITALRNERNKTYLNNLHTKLLGFQQAVTQAMVDTVDRERRLSELRSQLGEVERDLAHEMRYVHRKFLFAWTGIVLVVIATFLQLPLT